MAAEQLYPIYYDNCVLVVTYDKHAVAPANYITFDIQPPVVPMGEPQRDVAAGQQIYQQREGNDRVTIVATEFEPFAVRTVEVGYYQSSSLRVEAAPGDNQTATLFVFNAVGTWWSRLDTTDYVQGKLQYDNIPGGQRTVYVKDSADAVAIGGFYCVAEIEPGPQGLLVDQFTADSGDVYKFYYRSDSTGRSLSFLRSISREPVLAMVSVAERGYEEGALIGDGFCEGTTRVRFRASLAHPFLSIEALVNSPTCNYEVIAPLQITSVEPSAPTAAPPATGSVDIQTSGGKAPVYAYIPGVSTFDVLLPNGMATVQGLAPGEYSVQVADSSSPAKRDFRTFRIPAYKVPIIDCYDPEARNYNPLTTQPDNALCVYTPQWRSLWPALPVEVHVDQVPMPAYIEASLFVGLPPGHPLVESRPLAFLTTLRATVSPRGVARFDLTPYLRGQFGALGQDGFRRLDINSPTAFNDDAFCYFRLKVGAQTIESGYVLNSAVADMSLYTEQAVPLTPFGKTLPFWPGYNFPLPVANTTGNGRYGLVQAFDPQDYEELDVRPLFLPCPKYGLPVRWLSPEGGYGYWVFAGKHQYGDDIGEGSTYQEAGTNEQRYSAAGVARRTYQVTTGPFSGRGLMEGLRTLRRAVQVWAQLEGAGSAWVPVVVGSGSFPAYREGQTRFEFPPSFTEAAPQYAQGQ